VYIRSLASRGSLGGLNARIIEICEVVCEAPYDIVVVETVGVGQSEVEIAGLADCTVVTLVPEAGDEVQTLKAGIMEIADIFVVNKADRADAEGFYRNLRILAHEKATENHETPVFKTVATTNTGIAELADSIVNQLATAHLNKEKRIQLLTEKSWQLMQHRLMRHIDYAALRNDIAAEVASGAFNLYTFTYQYLKKNQLPTGAL
jgi:LAO/AO transport system kinase